MLAVGLCTTPASAHTPVWSVTCNQVKVDLTLYNASVTNTVSLTIGDKEVVKDQVFKSEDHFTESIADHTSPVQVHLVVKAGDGAQYSVDQTKTAPVCQGTPPSSPAPSKPAPKPTPTKSAPAPSQSASAPAPAPSNSPSPSGGLAETGSSSSTPYIAGGAAVVVLAGGGILLATRRRASARS
jgi:LPXTG-motif cell wall-anchored protein